MDGVVLETGSAYSWFIRDGYRARIFSLWEGVYLFGTTQWQNGAPYLSAVDLAQYPERPFWQIPRGPWTEWEPWQGTPIEGYSAAAAGDAHYGDALPQLRLIANGQAARALLDVTMTGGSMDAGAAAAQAKADELLAAGAAPELVGVTFNGPDAIELRSSSPTSAATSTTTRNNQVDFYDNAGASGPRMSVAGDEGMHPPVHFTGAGVLLMCLAIFAGMYLHKKLK